MFVASISEYLITLWFKMSPKNYSNITAVEEELKHFCNQNVVLILDSPVLKELKESIIDFLYRLKDKHPSSTILLFITFLFYYNPKKKFFDAAHRVMKFMCDYKLKPSDSLIEEYRQSKTTKTLNRLPSKQDWMKIDMNEKTYDRLKKAYRRKIIKIK